MSGSDPAYEFPTGDKTARVLARKHRRRAEWLATTLAADGDAREGRVAIPELGKITLLGLPKGAVYRAASEKGKASLKSLD